MKTKTKIRFGFFCTCGAADFHVVRTTLAKGRILRRRQCLACGARITTAERPICSVVANTPATSVGQLAQSLRLLSDRPITLPLPPQN